MKIANRTDIGRIRTINEDRCVVQPNLNGFSLAIVADGMGGHQAGDVASQMAIERIQEQLQSVHTGMSIEEAKKAVREAIEQANRQIYEFASSRDQYRGMGTTVVVVLAEEEYILIGHIGDSRAYLCNQGKFIQLTEDHSLVSELVRSGQITQEEASVHPRRNVLTQALGTEARVEVSLNHFPWHEEDLVLLCTDGLSGLVDSEVLFAILRTKLDLQRKANQLVERALIAGGDDNVTVILLANEPSKRGDQP